MAHDYGHYWEATSLADYSVASNLEARVGAVLAFLERAGVRSVLEVGAGPGAIAARAAGLGLQVAAADVAVAFVPELGGRAVRAAIDRLPVGDGAVEAVVAAEVLEHLNAPVLAGALKELQRVARRWVVITVPHREQLEYEQLACPACHGHFNSSGHLRETSREIVRGWFPAMRLYHVEPIGERRLLPGGLGRWMRLLAGATNPSWEAGAYPCPLCGGVVPLATPGDSWRAWTALRLRSLMWHLGRRVPGHMLYVFERDGGGARS